MTSYSSFSSRSVEARPEVRVRVEGSSVPGLDRVFTEPFTIGRGIQATLHVDSGRVSRIHAEVVFEGGRWLLRDAGSTNGTYRDGERVETVPLVGEVEVRLGREGPVVRLEVGEAGPDRGAAPVHDDPARGGLDGTRADRAGGTTSPQHGGMGWLAREEEDPVRDEPTHERERPAREAGHPAPGPDASVSQVIRRYFDDKADGPVGERTMMIRRAYQEVQTKQKRTYGGVIGGVAVLLIAALGFAIWQQVRLERLAGTAETLFYDMKEQDLRTVQLLSYLDIQDAAELEAQLAEQREASRRLALRYDGYVEQLGLYRALTEEEREIYRVARIFNESEFSIPAGFIQAVQQYIGYWKSTSRFENGIRHAEQNGYIPVIVRAFQRYGLPPEFFYLALQESDFIPERVGPWTRFGHAKGMWQFIPSTGSAYGLTPGPREDLGVYDPQDERHDFEKSTEAAARYLADIYTELAQASGLLAMASYNWGEHRVIPKLNRLQEEGQRDFFASLPKDPQQRSYWRFLNEYEDRMPEETKNYVLHIFAAAVIGQNPRLFGFDFDNPLTPYLQGPAPAPSTASLTHP